MPKISPTTEMLLMCTFGLVSTIYESSVQNINENIKEVWALDFPPDTIIGTESLVKSIMTAIALARGLTVHIYIAAYLLMFFPLLFEHGISLLLIWMLLCAIRSVVVNLVTLLTGCLICASHSELKQVGFEFAAAKAVEIACSVFMWLSVNDYHIGLRNERRRNILASRMRTKTTQITDSDLSLVSSSDMSDFLDFEDEECDSDDSVMVKAAVEWLMRMAFGVKYENRRMEMDSVKAQKFLNMSPDELKELQNRIRDKLLENSFGGKIVQSPEVLAGISMSLQKFNEDTADNDLRNNSYGNEDKKKDAIAVEHRSRSSTQSIGSQTKEPSKKLQERLSKETIPRQDQNETNFGVDTMKSKPKTMPQKESSVAQILQERSPSVRKSSSQTPSARKVSSQALSTGKSTSNAILVSSNNGRKTSAEAVKRLQEQVMQNDLMKDNKGKSKPKKPSNQEMETPHNQTELSARRSPRDDVGATDNSPTRTVSFRRKPGY